MLVKSCTQSDELLVKVTINKHKSLSTIMQLSNEIK